MTDLLLGYVMDVLRWTFLAVLTLIYPDNFTPWTGTVIRVIRPDEITVVTKRDVAVNVRLYGIDCPAPEGGQPFGKEAQEYVMQRTLGKTVRVRPVPARYQGRWYFPRIRGQDDLTWDPSPKKYERIYALVTIDGESLNEELLKNGMAWWYRPFVPFERGYKYLEDKARERKVGLWALADPKPPWVYGRTPIVESDSKEGEAVHLWVKRDPKDYPEDVVEAPAGSQPEQPAVPQKESPPPATDARPVEPVAAEKKEREPPESPAIPVSPPAAPPTTAEEARPKAPSPETAAPVPEGPPMPCSRMLKEIRSLLRMQEAGQTPLLKKISQKPTAVCVKGDETIYCFKCLIVGERQETIEMVEKEGRIVEHSFRECRCEMARER